MVLPNIQNYSWRKSPIWFYPAPSPIWEHTHSLRGEYSGPLRYVWLRFLIIYPISILHIRCFCTYSLKNKDHEYCVDRMRRWTIAETWQQLPSPSNDHHHPYLLATHLVFLALSDFVFGKTFWLSCDVAVTPTVTRVYLTPELETMPSIFAALTFDLNDGPAPTSGNDIFAEMVTEIMLAPMNQFPASFLNSLYPWLLLPAYMFCTPQIYISMFFPRFLL